jgi:hypothetical protein
MKFTEEKLEMIFAGLLRMITRPKTLTFAVASCAKVRVLGDNVKQIQQNVQFIN